MPMSQGLPIEHSGKTSLAGILSDTLHLYGKHWKNLTLPLLSPVLQILLGAYASVILSYLYLHEVSARFPDFMMTTPLLFWGGYLLIALGSLFVFKRGFLAYALCCVSLNINARECILGSSPDFNSAYRIVRQEKFWPYMSLLGAYCLAPLAGGLPLVACVMLAMLSPEATLRLLLFIVGLLLTLLAGVFTLVFMWFATFIFQIVAFEPLSANPLPTFLNSFGLVWRAPWRTLGLQVLLMLFTCYAVPLPIIGLFRLMHLSAPLDAFHDWAIRLILSGISPEWQDMANIDLLTMLPGGMNFIVHSLSDNLLAVILTSILLPIGSLAFTHLYLGLKHQTGGQEEAIPQSESAA